MEGNQTQEDPQTGTQQTQGTPETQNEDIAAIKAQLDEEQKAKYALEEAMAEKDAKLAKLASVKEARDEAVSKYLGMAKASNPQVPQDMISGETIAEIDSSVEKGKVLVAAVKKTLESEAAAAKVPAGAPTRSESTEGMSNKEMIAAGLRQKGGVVA